MRFLRPFTACFLAVVPMFAQRLAQNPANPSFTHIQLNSAGPDAAISFWTDIIGTTTTSRGSSKGVSTLGVLILFTEKAPSGPSAGSVIDHIAFRVPDLQPFTAKLAKTKFKSFQPKPGVDVLMVDGPDGVRIELIEDNSMYAPLEFSHIHVLTANPADTQAWYGKTFGARPGSDDQARTTRFPGAAITFDSAPSVQPTIGRAIDHLSFEVKDLQGFSKALDAAGVKVDAPAEAPASAKGSRLSFTDPWGTRIEVAETPTR